jgi:hypothetical protein
LDVSSLRKLLESFADGVLAFFEDGSVRANTVVLYIEKDKDTIYAGILSSKRFLKYEPILE